MARELHKTVGELLYGPMPLSAYEYAEWLALWKLEEQAAERAREDRE